MFLAGEMERVRSHHHHFRDSDKLRKIEKQDKLDKLDQFIEGPSSSSDKMKHLEAQMLCKIKAMDLDPNTEEEVKGRRAGLRQDCCEVFENVVNSWSMNF